MEEEKCPCENCEFRFRRCVQNCEEFAHYLKKFRTKQEDDFMYERGERA